MNVDAHFETGNRDAIVPHNAKLSGTARSDGSAATVVRCGLNGENND